MYNRPLKDPLLLSYTLEELYYEFRDKIEREKAIEDMSKEEADKIDQKKIDDAMAWAAEEEAKELEVIKESTGLGQDMGNDENWTPSEDDKKWMDEHIKQAKAVYGDDFGENIDEVF